MGGAQRERCEAWRSELLKMVLLLSSLGGILYLQYYMWYSLQ